MLAFELSFAVTFVAAELSAVEQSAAFAVVAVGAAVEWAGV